VDETGSGFCTMAGFRAIGVNFGLHHQKLGYLVSMSHGKKRCKNGLRTNWKSFIWNRKIYRPVE
jgi:hypothetical protein